jgi:hypothetical protein
MPWARSLCQDDIRDRDAVFGPLGDDQRGQAHRRIASLTHYAECRIMPSVPDCLRDKGSALALSA